MTADVASPPTRLVPPGLAGPLRVVERRVEGYRRTWWLLLSGMADSLLFLFAVGIGVGALVGEVDTPAGLVPYRDFVAPAMLANAAMNGAAFDTTIDFFIKYKYQKHYDAMLATPLGIGDVVSGETAWALLRSAVYATAFLLAMILFGLVHSWWAVLAVPAAVLVAFAFAGLGLAGTTFMRSWLDFDFVNLALVPMFLFSATFFPLSQYPSALRPVVQATPLYQGVALERALVSGHVGWASIGHGLYLFGLGCAGLAVARRRLRHLLQP